MKIDKGDPGHWLILLRQGLYTLLAICARHLQAKPRGPVVVLYGHQLSGNLKALYEKWQHSYTDAFDCYFLSLDPRYGKILKSEGVNVLRCGNLRDMLLVGRCSAIITDHGLHAMSPFISLTNILFIDVWHGIPYKGFIPDNFRVQHRYDEVWVSSPLLKQIYQDKFGFRADIVHSLGYARADRLFLRQKPDPSFRKKASIPTESKIVLYAPTWQQDEKGRELFPFGESQDSFLQSLSEICEKHKAVLIIRSHLNATISTTFFRNVRYCSMKEFPDAEDLLQQSDILICDWSSIAFEFLALNRPTIFLDVPPPFKNGFSLGPEYRFGKIAGDMGTLLSAVSSYAQDPLHYQAEYAAKHQEVVTAVYGDNTTGESARHQWDHLSRLIG